MERTRIPLMASKFPGALLVSINSQQFLYIEKDLKKFKIDRMEPKCVSFFFNWVNKSIKVLNRISAAKEPNTVIMNI